MTDRTDFLSALNRNLTDSTALAGSLPENLRDAAATGLGAATAAADADTLVVSQSSTNKVQTFAAVKTWIKSWIVKGDVGLSNVANLAPADLGISEDTQEALDLKAPLESPTFTGTPAVPTAAQGTNTTQAASTAFVVAEIAAAGSGAGDVSGPASSVTDNLVSFSSTTGKAIKDSGLALDTDTTLAANSDSKVASQKATKAYVDALIAASDAMVFKGVIDCSANPNYPAADRGWTYRVSVAGKIGGASGTNVEAGDMLLCLTDSTSAGTQAAVGANWAIIQTNIDGAVVGPTSATDATVAGFNGATGKIIKQLSATEIRAAASLATTDSPQFTGVNLGHASDTTLTRSAAGVLAVEGTVVAMAGKQAIPIPAGAMKATTTNGAASGTAEMTTNKNMVVTLDFDASTQEFAQFSIPMPKSWNESTITFVPHWSHASTTTNFGVVWQLQAVAVSNDDALDVAFGTAQTSTDTGGTTNDYYAGPESSAITIAGSPAENDLVMFQVARVPANGSDTMAIDARLHGITLYITTNAGNDA